jgi:hypothetical protein
MFDFLLQQLDFVLSTRLVGQGCNAANLQLSGTEDRGQRTEDRGQRTEVRRSGGPEVRRSGGPEVRGQGAEVVKGQKSRGRCGEGQGIYNLTKAQTPVLVHFGNDWSQQWLLVRVEQPKQPGE